VFEDLWNYIVKRSRDAGIPVVQNKEELEYVFNLLKDCKSYLEIGTAEGNSLYVLTNALPKGSEVAYIDLGEPHTEAHRKVILDQLKDYKICAVHGDSNNLDNVLKLSPRLFDAVLIDAGHDDFNVAIDAFLYGPMAKKYIIFHDIQLPDVNRAYEWYCRQKPQCKNYRVVNSGNFGYGIIEV